MFPSKKSWAHKVEQARTNKDQWFKTEHDSPLPHNLREQFRGLDYYPPNADLHLELKLQRNPDRETVQMDDTGGATRTYLKYGHFEFTVDGQPTRVWAYRQEGGHQGHESLFIPFRDSTSGKETYGAGRYLDVPVDPEDNYSIDFNEAYNPYCAYNPSYSCPLPPVENWLKVPIRAGEKEFPLKDQVDAVSFEPSHSH